MGLFSIRVSFIKPVHTLRRHFLCVIYSARVCLLTLMWPNGPANGIITVGTSVITDQSTVTIHATTESVQSAYI